MHSGIHVRGVPSTSSSTKESASSLQGIPPLFLSFVTAILLRNTTLIIIIINCCCVVEYCTKTLDHDVRCMVYVEEDKEMHIAEFDGTILSISIEVCSCVLVIT